MLKYKVFVSILCICVLSVIPIQSSQASITAPNVQTHCSGSILTNTFACRVTIDREATSGLNFIRIATKQNSTSIINGICNSYGTALMTDLRDQLTAKLNIFGKTVLLKFPWNVSCVNTLLAVNTGHYWSGYTLAQTLSTAANKGGCLSAWVDVSGFISYLWNQFPWWPFPIPAQLGIREQESLSNNASFIPVSSTYKYCKAK